MGNEVGMRDIVRCGVVDGRLEWAEERSLYRTVVTCRCIAGRVEWLWVTWDVPALVFDDDLFDAEILVERMGIDRFTTDDMCRVFGVERNTIFKAIQRGSIPAPAWPAFHSPRGEGHKPHEWSKAQVARVIFERRGTERRPGLCAFGPVAAKRVKVDA